MLVDSLKSFKSKIHTKLNSHDKRAKIQDSDFIIALLKAVAEAKDNFSLSELRLSVCNFLSVSIGASAFNERIGTVSLKKQLRMALHELIQSAFLHSSSKASLELADQLGVSEVIGVDGSMVTLWDGLQDTFKGTFTEAAIKLHMAINLVTGSISWFDFTPGATHDSKRFPEIRSEVLYIIDLGYWSFPFFQQIIDRSAYFLSRVKGNARLKISRVVHGLGLSAVGKELLDIPFKRKRKEIVELYATAVSDRTETAFRILGFWNKKLRIYHWYITNLSGSRKHIYSLYRLRWQIELSFKSMKSTLNFDRIPTLNPNAAESFGLISLINYLFSTIFREEAEISSRRVNSKSSGHSSIQKAAKAFREGAKDIFDGLKIGKRMTVAWIDKLEKNIKPLLEFVFDPNRNQRKNAIGSLLCD